MRPASQETRVGKRRDLGDLGRNSPCWLEKELKIVIN